MKTRRQFLCAAWLAACVLFLLSACRGPTPIAGRVAETTATEGASNTPLPATPTASHTPTAESTATPTRPAIDTATPTDTSTPTVEPTETSTPTPTAEMVTGPAIAGLSLKSDGKGGMLYVAEKGNPYGVDVGEVVGRPTSIQVKGIGGKVRNPIDGTFEKVGFEQRSGIVINNQKVLAYFTNKENTLDKVRAGEWKIALPFEPGPETKIWELTFPDYIGNQSYVAISGLPINNVVVNPFSQRVLAKSHPLQNGVFDVGLFLPDSVAPERGINYALSIMYSSAGQVFVDNSGKHMNPGAQLIKNIKGQVPEMWATNAQAVLAVGTTQGTKDFAIARHILTVGESFVFAGAN